MAYIDKIRDKDTLFFAHVQIFLYLCTDIFKERIRVRTLMKEQIGQLFDRIASTYDGLNHGLSLNIDRRWRRRAVASMPAATCVLDVAIGTGDLAIEILRQGKAQQLTGIDLSMEMMRIGRQKCEARGLSVEFIYGNAQAMPFADASFDGVTCAYGCRNFSDLDAGLREMYRVLRPGGQLTILEFSNPTNPVVRAFYSLYFDHLLPFVGRLVSRDQTAYTYLNRSVRHFCQGEEFLSHLREAGFSDLSAQPLTFGITTLYIATKS